MIIDIGDGVTVKVKKTDRRRSAEINIEAGQVIVTVPSSISDIRLNQLIKSRTSWIKSRLKIQTSIPVPKEKEFVNGESISYLGRNYRIKITQGNPEVLLKNGYLNIKIPKSVTEVEKRKTVRNLIVNWYETHALRGITKKISRFQQIFGVKPTSVTIKDFKTKWASCGLNGDLTFNWRILMAPNRVVDYVVAHELAHLIKHNHSEEFWKVLKKVIPDHEQDKDWLKNNAVRLFLV